MRYDCLCDFNEARTGKYCEIEISPCLSFPCDNGYKCESLEFDITYQCVCDAFFCQPIFYVVLVAWSAREPFDLSQLCL